MPEKPNMEIIFGTPALTAPPYTCNSDAKRQTPDKKAHHEQYIRHRSCG